MLACESEAEIDLSVRSKLNQDRLPTHARQPLLHEVNARHRLHGKGRASTFAFWCVRGDQHNQRYPWHHALHLCQELTRARALGRQVQPRSACFMASIALAYLRRSAQWGRFTQTLPSTAAGTIPAGGCNHPVSSGAVRQDSIWS